MKKLLLLLLCVNYAFGQTQTSVQTTINTNLVNPLRTINIKNSVTAVNELAGKAAADAATALSQIAGLQAGQNPETDPTVPANVKSISATNINNWNTAFGWGNHALAGYLTSVGSVPYANITGVPNFLLSGSSIPYATLTGVPAESDPTVPSNVKGITATNISNWNSAFGWGNHASAGYLTSATAASTYQTLSNLSIDLTASNTKYPTTTAVNTGLSLKANADSPTITGTATLPASTSIGTVSATEISYVDGVTSALQGQLDAKLAAATAGTTYQTLANLSTDLTASATKYPSVNAVNTGLGLRATTTYVDGQIATREPTITAGTTAQYWRGDKTWQPFPTIPTNANYVDLTTAQSVGGVKTHTALTKYSTDLSGSYDARTLTDKAYVDAAVAAVAPVTPAYAKREIFFEPQGNSTTVNTLGLAMTAQGTATTRNVNTASLYGRSRRIGYTSGTAANAVAGVIGLQQFQVAAPFSFKGVFGIQSYDAGHRYTIGMGNTSDATVNPSTLINRIHMYADPGDATFKVVSSGATLGTPVDLGANFPSNTATTDVYDVNFTIIPGGTTVSYTIKRLNTGDVATGTLTGLPTGVLLSPQITASNAATGTSANIDVMRAMIITDN